MVQCLCSRKGFVRLAVEDLAHQAEGLCFIGEAEHIAYGIRLDIDHALSIRMHGDGLVEQRQRVAY